MDFILEFNKFYEVGDVVLVHYWYNDMITPVKILEKTSRSLYRVSHKTKMSKIKNAPDEVIKSSDILDLLRV